MRAMAKVARPQYPAVPALTQKYELISVRRYKAGYEVRTERVSWVSCEGSETIIMRSAYTPEGHYIGNPKRAYRLCKVRGIRPELASPNDNVCSIGFCEREQKWYGWSHRAIHGFGVGDVAQEGDLCTQSGYVDGYLEEHPELDCRVPVGFKAETLDDAKRMAIAFAESVR